MARRSITKAYKTDEGEVEITIQALGGIEGGLLGIKLGEVFAPSMAAIITAFTNDDAPSILAAMAAMFTKLPPSEFKSMLTQLMSGAQAKLKGEFVDINLTVLDDTFAGSPGSIYRLAYDAIRLNFKNFGAELGFSAALATKLQAVAARAATKVASKVQTPSSTTPPTPS